MTGDFSHSRSVPPLVKLVSRQLVTVNVSHERYCDPLGECHCTTGIFGRAKRSRATGVRGVARVEKTFPPSITFPAFVSISVPEATLEETEVAAALKSKALRRMPR